jgi:hypothetical protein
MNRRTYLLCAVALPALAANAAAQAQYDRKLEQAVMSVVARKIGDLRPSFGPKQHPALVDAGAPALQGPAKSPTRAPSAWHIATAETDLRVSSEGSFQTFSDGTKISREERRKLATKSVSRIINF